MKKTSRQLSTLRNSVFLWKTRSIITLTEESWKLSEVEELVRGVERGEVAPENYPRVLNACIKLKQLALGKRIHNHIIKSGREASLSLGNQIVNMYAKCGSLADARACFDLLPRRDVFSWTAILTAFAENGHCIDALRWFMLMEQDGVRADKVILLVLLKCCSSSHDLRAGLMLHSLAQESGLISELVVSNAIINMFGKCRCPELSQATFDAMEERSLISWTSAIEAQAQNCFPERALHLFRLMQLEGVKPNVVTLSVTIEACASPSFLKDGCVLHSSAAETGLETQLILGTGLVPMYVLCGCLEEAFPAFQALNERSRVSWSIMIQAFAESGREQEAFGLFHEMLLEGVRPDSITFLPLLNSCSSSQKLETGRFLHQQLSAGGFDDSNVKNCLVTMYGRCGDVDSAAEVFSSMKNHDEISWNALLGAYGENRDPNRAYVVFCEMLQAGVKASRVSFLTILSLCGSLRGATASIHKMVEEAGVEDNAGVQTALVSAYVKCNLLEKAERVLDGVYESFNTPSLNALMGGFAQLGLVDRALKLLRQMLLQGLKLTEVTFATAFDACSSATSIEHGRFVRSLVDESPALNTALVRNSLLKMYSSCGKLEEACEHFFKEPLHDVVSWSYLIESFARLGRGEQALLNFYRMQQDGFIPNSLSFKTILSACSHSGLLSEGARVFESLLLEQQQLGAEVSSLHLGCMIDLLGRAGETELAEKLLRRISESDEKVGKLELVLLGACRNHGDFQRGERAGAGVLERNDQAAGYVLLSHLYSASSFKTVEESKARNFKFARA